MRFARVTTLALGSALALGACESTDEPDAVRSDGGRDAGFDAARASSDAAVVDTGTARADGAADAAADSTTVQLRFSAKVGAAELACGQKYPNLGTTRVTAEPLDFRMFLQDVRLITKSGSEVSLQLDERLPYQTKDVALLDFTNGAGACTVDDANTNTVIVGRVPAGEYTGVSFTTGVPDPLNHGDPNTAPPPLKARGAFWSWLGGYRFVMAGLLPVAHQSDAGHAGVPPPSDAGAHDAGQHSASDASADGGGHAGHVPARGTEVHVGSMGCTGTPAVGFTCSKANRNRVVLSGFDATKHSIVADLGALFADVDLSAGGVCHSSGASCPAPFAALGLSFESGSATGTQTVFRVE